MSTATLHRLAALGAMIGSTPLLGIFLHYKGRQRRVFAKAEHYNLTGSIKDRMALHILRGAYASGALRPGAPIGEATSGNTGISFSALGCALGHPVTIFMPDWMSQERKGLIRSFGARTKLVSKEEGGFLGSIQLSVEWAERTEGAFLPCQFANEANAEAHYESTGPEIARQLRARSLVPDAFVAGVGTGGTVMGVGRYLREQNPLIRVHPVEPASSPTLSTGFKVGKHRIQGISDDFIPAILKLDALDAPLAVDDGDAILMAQKLAGIGLGVGISSGANIVAALMAQDLLGPDAVVVTVLSDDNKKYLSTDLTQVEPVCAGMLSPQVELTGFSVIGCARAASSDDSSVALGAAH